MNASILQLAFIAVSGYWLLTRLLNTRYKAAREAGYHLFFKSLFFGLLLLILAGALVEVLLFLSSSLNFFILDPGQKKVFAALGVTLALAWLVPLIGDWLPGSEIRRERSILKAARERGDFLEILLETARTQSDFVELSLSDGKTYIGFVVDSGILSQGENTDISLVPVWGGYREKDTRQLLITHDYFEAVLAAPAESDLRTVIPADQVDIARIIPREDAEYQFKYQRAESFKAFSETEGGEALSSLRGPASQK